MNTSVVAAILAFLSATQAAIAVFEPISHGPPSNFLIGNKIESGATGAIISPAATTQYNYFAIGPQPIGVDQSSGSTRTLFPQIPAAPTGFGQPDRDHTPIHEPNQE